MDKLKPGMSLNDLKKAKIYSFETGKKVADLPTKQPKKPKAKAELSVVGSRPVSQYEISEHNGLQHLKHNRSQEKITDETFEPLPEHFLNSKMPLSNGALDEIRRHVQYSGDIFDRTGDPHQDVDDYHRGYLDKLENRVKNSLYSIKKKPSKSKKSSLPKTSKRHGMEIFHATKPEHASLQGIHLLAPDEHKLDDAIQTAHAQGFPRVVVHRTSRTFGPKKLDKALSGKSLNDLKKAKIFSFADRKKVADLPSVMTQPAIPGKTRSGKDVHGLEHEGYRAEYKPRGYSIRVDATNALTPSDSGKILRMQFPEYTREDHADAAKAHAKHAEHLDELHCYTKQMAERQHYPEGRDSFAQWRISGGVDPAYGEEVNNKLRELSHASSKHLRLSAGHKEAARRTKPVSKKNETEQSTELFHYHLHHQVLHENAANAHDTKLLFTREPAIRRKHETARQNHLNAATAHMRRASAYYDNGTIGGSVPFETHLEDHRRKAGGARAEHQKFVAHSAEKGQVRKSFLPGQCLNDLKK